MKIVSVDIIDVKNPLQSAVAKWRPVVVRINTDEGVSGLAKSAWHMVSGLLRASAWQKISLVF